MSQEVYEMITRLDRERIETHLVVQCAPMISGMKVSNLLNVEKKLAPQMKQVLERSGISHYLLLESEVWSRLQNFHMRWDYCSVILWKMWRDSLRTKVTIICMPATGKCTDM